MSNSEFRSVLADKSLNQVTLSEVKPSKAEVNLVKPQPVTKTADALFILPLCFLIVWATTVSIVSGIWKVTLNERVTFKHLERVPCKNCQFFTNNHYLKCAVHPSIALTQQAINCSDYCPKITE